MTGATRGIGLAIVKTLAGRPGATVYATARDKSGTGDLYELAQVNKQVKILGWRADHHVDSKDLADAIRAESGYLDVVISNAGG